MSKFCFVIMGYGEKTDYLSGRKLNLDNTYHNLIKPAVESVGYTCVRSDEVLTTGYIEKPMYSLLIHADLVIADLSTLNPNALYELGIRHASRPFSTIIIAEDGLKGAGHPFDLNHLNTLFYHHLGEDIGVSERDRFILELSNTIKLKESCDVDSPLYSFIPYLTNHNLSEDEIQNLINIVLKNESEQSELLYKANNLMDNDEFANAFLYWDKLTKINPDETYFIQQKALSKYKSGLPTSREALEEGRSIIETITCENDPETLGIAGAIYKRLFYETQDIFYLNTAIDYYKKGFIMNSNYYNGENYATCLEILYMSSKHDDEKVYCKFESNKIRKRLVEICERQFEINNINDRLDIWLIATMANTYYYFGQLEKYESFDKSFRELSDSKWMIETYELGLKHIEKYKGDK